MLNHRLHHGQWLWNDEWLVLLCPLYTIHTHRSRERTKENAHRRTRAREPSRAEPKPNEAKQRSITHGKEIRAKELKHGTAEHSSTTPARSRKKCERLCKCECEGRKKEKNRIIIMIIAIAIHVVRLLQVYLRAEALSMNYKHTQSGARASVSYIPSYVER